MLTFILILMILFQNIAGTDVDKNSLFRYSPYVCHDNNERELWTSSVRNIGFCFKECHSHGVCKSITYNSNTKTCSGRSYCPSVCRNSSISVTMDTASYCRRDCYTDDVNNTRSCYRWSLTQRFSWANAKLFCKHGGSHLAEITTSGENSFIRSILNDDARYWTGGVMDVGGEWVWDHTSLPFTFTFWITDQPHNNPDENYMMLNRNLKWQSQPADMMAYPLCEETMQS